MVLMAGPYIVYNGDLTSIHFAELLPFPTLRLYVHHHLFCASTVLTIGFSEGCLHAWVACEGMRWPWSIGQTLNPSSWQSAVLSARSADHLLLTSQRAAGAFVSVLLLAALGKVRGQQSSTVSRGANDGEEQGLRNVTIANPSRLVTYTPFVCTNSSRSCGDGGW